MKRTTKESLNKSEFRPLPPGEGGGEGVNSKSYPLTLSRRERELNQSSPKGIQRRTFIKAALAAGAAGIARPLLANPAPKSRDDVLPRLFGETPITPSNLIAIDMPGLAEDGSVVPITVQAPLDGAESITLIAENNPIPLIGTFDLGPGVYPFIATRIKLAQSSRVMVVVKAKAGLYSASRFVRVIKGGCD